ncbi:MAG: hypothetical protein AB7O53_08945, partial [Thermoleophilia bacterium]
MLQERPRLAHPRAHRRGVAVARRQQRLDGPQQAGGRVGVEVGRHDDGVGAVRPPDGPVAVPAQQAQHGLPGLREHVDRGQGRAAALGGLAQPGARGALVAQQVGGHPAQHRRERPPGARVVVRVVRRPGVPRQPGDAVLADHGLEQRDGARDARGAARQGALVARGSGDARPVGDQVARVVDARPRGGQRQRRAAAHLVGREGADHLAQGRQVPRRLQGGHRPPDEVRGLVHHAARQQVMDRPQVVALAERPRRGAALEDGHEVRLAPPELGPEHLGEQVVMAEAVGSGVGLDDEVVARRDGPEVAGRHLFAEDRGAAGRRQHVEHRRARQHGELGGRGAAQHLLREVVRDVAVAAADPRDRGRRVGLAPGGHAGEDDPRGPPLRALEQPLQGGVPDGDPEAVEYDPHLRGVHREVVLVDLQEPARGAHGGEGQPGGRAARQHQAGAGGEVAGENLQGLALMGPV